MDGFDPDAFIASQTAPTPAAGAQSPNIGEQQPNLGGFDPDSFIEDATQEKYGTPGQQLKAGVEGVAKGVAGPLATLAETKILGVKPEDIRGRQEANPVTEGAGQTAGLVGGFLTGTGEAAVMTKAGELAAHALELGSLAQDASLGYKVGSSAVQQAAEMAVLQSGDESSKLLLQDPNASAQSALANIGLAAALGGTGGAFVSGVVSPLWDATAGPKVTEFLSGLKSHLNGGSLTLPEERQAALQTLGIDIGPATRSAMSGDPRAMQMFNELRESQHPEVMADIQNLRKASSDSVLQSLGVAPETVENYSENTAGHNLYDTFENEYRQKYEPIAKQLNERNEMAAGINVPDEARLHKYGQILEKGMQDFGTDSPLYKEYSGWGNRLLAKDTIGGLDMLKTELGGELKKAYRAGDSNMIKALGDIRSAISDFQENQINKAASESLVKSTGKSSEDLLAHRAAANANYAQFAKMSSDLSGHLGVGEFKGFGNLTGKLEDKISAEGLLKKFSPKNNADIIPFLQKHFPETLEAVRQNEVAQILKPAVLGAKGEESIDMNKLSKTIRTGLAGREDYIKWAMPPEALDKIGAADTLMNALPALKSSGTAGWLMKLTRHLPMSAMAGVGLLMGHNPVSAALIGEASERLGVHAPNAVKLGLLKFMGSEQPVEAKGFKSMIDYMHNTAKGETMIAKATHNLFKAGSQVLLDSQMPNTADKEKLDKMVTKVQEDPNVLMRLGNGHTGHYMPDHQVALAESSAAALNYLKSIKPMPFKSSPLDKEIPPSSAAMARYNRALDIAQQPAVVLQHIKDGTLQATDIADLRAMYPALYNRFADKLTNVMAHRSSEEEHIPYKTRVGMSLFLGQPLDSTMTPQAILSAQPQPQQSPQMQSPKGRPSALKGKSTNMYKTPGQAAESDRSNRD